MQVVGIFMIKNEDVYIEQAILNVVDFCDVIYVEDNESTDGTPEILQRLADKFKHIHVRTISDTKESNEHLVQYFDTDTWVFAVDGDELYDPDGLREMRDRLEAGEFDDWWMIYGNCLHINKFDHETYQAKGYLSPPSKSMTKLYNFSLISDFPITDERLHGHPVFKVGPQETKSRKLHLLNQKTWDNAFFRCAHMAFVQRTSKPQTQKTLFGLRLNPPQIYTLKKIWREHGVFYALPRTIKLMLQLISGRDSRTQHYKQGGLKTINIKEFLNRQ